MIDHEAILARKLRALFPDAAAHAKVREELGQYGQASYEREVPRVHLAILKLAGNSLERIREWMPIAKQDYRDV
ncbi:MAG: hypothetical protein HYV26_23190, partial [Candidatus Hydrogenedentes bacterium]|nr:hypothetical protein [Candidatus Hydrogenedentota bacterium]